MANNDQTLMAGAQTAYHRLEQSKNMLLTQYHATHDHQSLMALAKDLLELVDQDPLITAVGMTALSPEHEDSDRIHIAPEFGYHSLDELDPDPAILTLPARSFSSPDALNPLCAKLDQGPEGEDRVIGIDLTRNWLRQQLQNTDPEAS